MPSIVVTNVSGTVLTNGVALDVGACRGVATPVTISGDGEIHISVNPDPDVAALMPVVVFDMLGNPVLNDDGTPQTQLETVMVPATPVSVTATDDMGMITVIAENTRFPFEGSFPLLHDPLTVV